MNTIKKVIKLCLKILNSFWKEICIRGKINSIRCHLKSESLVQPSRATLMGFLKLKNRQVYKIHKLFH
jgi:hypothetical protein